MIIHALSSSNLMNTYSVLLCYLGLIILNKYKRYSIIYICKYIQSIENYHVIIWHVVNKPLIIYIGTVCMHPYLRHIVYYHPVLGVCISDAGKKDCQYLYVFWFCQWWVAINVIQHKSPLCTIYTPKYTYITLERLKICICPDASSP